MHVHLVSCLQKMYQYIFPKIIVLALSLHVYILTSPQKKKDVFPRLSGDFFSSFRSLREDLHTHIPISIYRNFQGPRAVEYWGRFCNYMGETQRD